jgi:hypothetical protein
MDVCYGGKEDFDAETGDEEVVACTDEEGGEDYKRGLDCVWGLYV